MKKERGDLSIIRWSIHTRKQEKRNRLLKRTPNYKKYAIQGNCIKKIYLFYSLRQKESMEKYPRYSHAYFMQKAIQLAQQAAEEGEVPIGAVVVAEGKKIIGKGYNQTEKLQDVTAHAEIIALSAASQYLGGKYLQNCTMYITLEPCTMCAGALGWSQISRIVYGAAELKKGFSQFKPRILHPKTEIITGILAEECQQILRAFFQDKRK
jgi:tRNA(adenine34) deaminase